VYEFATNSTKPKEAELDASVNGGTLVTRTVLRAGGKHAVRSQLHVQLHFLRKTAAFRTDVADTTTLAFRMLSMRLIIWIMS
jgi:hypothetical protein